MRSRAFFLSLLAASGAVLAPGSARTAPPDAPLPPTGQVRVNVKSGFYALHVPSGYDARKSWPLIVWLHGSGNTGEGNRDMWVNDLRNRRRDEEFIVLVPHQEWMATRKGTQGTDYAVIVESIDDVLKKYRIDAKRTLLSSHSGGGPPSQKLILERAALFAAFAPWSNNFRGWSPKPLAGKPVYLLWGDRDHELIIDKNAFGETGEGPAHHKATALAELERYERLIVPDNGHEWGRRVNDRILEWFDRIVWEDSLPREARAAWDSVRAFRWGEAEKAIERLRKKGESEPLAQVEERFKACREACDADIVYATGARKAFLTRVAAEVCWAKTDRGKTLRRDLKEFEREMGRTEKEEARQCADAVIVALGEAGGAGRDGKARLTAESEIRRIRSRTSDPALKRLCEEILNRLWLDAFGYLTLKK